MSESATGPSASQRVALKCEACGAKAVNTYYCRRHDVMLCGGCAWSRHSGCIAWRVHEEEPEVDADQEMLSGARRLSERMKRFVVEREREAAQARLSRRVNAVVLAGVVGLVALMLILALGCSSSVPGIIQDRAPAARRAAEVYVERTEPRADLTEEEREETRALGEALIRYLREMEAATR